MMRAGTSRWMAGVVLLLVTGLAPCAAQEGRERPRQREQAPNMSAEEAAARATRHGKGGPNEPAGFRPLTMRDFDAQVEEGWGSRGDPGFQIAQDPSSPGTPPNIGRAVYPRGFLSGRGPIMTNFDVPGRPRKLYLSFWLRLSDNWDGHPTGVNKIFHIWIAGGNKVYLSAQGKGTGPYRPQVNLQGIPGPQKARNLIPRHDRAIAIQRGVWSRWEVLLSSNHPGAFDGSVTWWINGRLAGSETGVAFFGREGEPGWQRVSWNPTWGGGGPPLSQRQWMDLDNVYVSVEAE